MSDYKLALVPANLVEAIYHLLEECLIPVVELGSGEISLESIKQGATSGETLLLVVTKGEEIVAVNLYEIRTFFTGKKCLYIPIIGGKDIDLWGEEFHEFSVQMAKNLGCTELRGLAARNGWIRKLKAHGIEWKECYTVVSHEFT
jgi:hypothetical protein